MRKILKKELITPAFNLLSSGSEIKGDVLIESDFRLDGKLYGSILCQGKLTVGKFGYVEGNIICDNAEISGQIKGNIKCSGIILLKECSTFKGDIKTSGIIIKNNSNLNITCLTKSVE